jgi:hypothetical protein
VELLLRTDIPGSALSLVRASVSGVCLCAAAPVLRIFFFFTFVLARVSLVGTPIFDHQIPCAVNHPLAYQDVTDRWVVNQIFHFWLTEACVASEFCYISTWLVRHATWFSLASMINWK